MASRFTLLRSIARPAAVVGTPKAQHALRRLFGGTSTLRFGLKESATPEQKNYDLHQRDSLEKQKKGKGHWKPELASDSEEAVKADRAAAESCMAMQERTKNAANERAKAGTSMGDGL